MNETREPTSSEASEAEAARHLVERIQAGESAAEAEMVERYSPGLRFLLRRWTRDASAAEEMHQEAFRLAIEKIRGGEPRAAAKLQAFLRGVARNLCTRFYQREERWNGADEADARLPDPRQDQLGLLLRREKNRLVLRVLDELPQERDREVLLRFYIVEEPKEQICADLGLDDLHFNRVLFRARRRLRELCEANELRG